jgi:hypothetical protein
MEDIMDIIFTAHKGKHLDRVENTTYTKKRKKA